MRASYATEGSLDAVVRAVALVLCDPGQEPVLSSSTLRSSWSPSRCSTRRRRRSGLTWNAETIVDPDANVSGSTCVLCWLDGFVYGSELIFVSGTAADAEATSSTRPTEDQRKRDGVLTNVRSHGASESWHTWAHIASPTGAVGRVSASGCGYGTAAVRAVQAVPVRAPALPGEVRSPYLRRMVPTLRTRTRLRCSQRLP